MKKIDVVSYNPNWINQYLYISCKIKKSLKDNLLNIYHIGSTSIPGMAAKPKIDIIGEVTFGKKTIKPLENIGFEYRGEWNIPMKFGFSFKGDIDCILHVYEKNHPEIELNLKFCEYLRNNPTSVEDYSKLKYEIINKPDSHDLEHAFLRNYTLKKHNFINEIIKKSEFDKLRLVYCSHYHEWEFFKKYNESYIGNNKNSNGNNCLIFYKGAEIIGSCYLESNFKNIFKSKEIEEMYSIYFENIINKIIKHKLIFS